MMTDQELRDTIRRMLADWNGATEAQRQTALALVKEVKIVRIPACDEHQGFYAMRAALVWECPVCGGPRGEVFPTISYDGSRRLGVDGWKNPCGHIDGYAAVRREAGLKK